MNSIQSTRMSWCSSSDSQTGFLPEAEKLSLKTVPHPKILEPSKFSGLIVNISASLLGKSLPFLCGVWGPRGPTMAVILP